MDSQVADFAARRHTQQARWTSVLRPAPSARAPTATSRLGKRTPSMLYSSFWLDTAVPARFPKLDRDLSVDVVIVGGGITGLTTAYLLGQAGKKVALLERRHLARVDTGHTTGHLTAVTDTRLRDLVSTWGKDHAFAAWDAGQDAIAQIEAMVRREEIACDFQRVPGYLTTPFFKDDTASEEPALREDLEYAREAGLDVEYVDRAPGLAVQRPAMRVANQGKFHITKYLAGLADRITAQGGLIFEESEAGEFQDDPRQVVACGHAIRCEQIVIATHTPLTGLASTLKALLLQTKIAAYDSYVLGARLPKGSVPEALWWDASDPYYYLRVERMADHDYAIWGGEDIKTGQDNDVEERYSRLERALLAVLPQAVPDRRWNGQVFEPSDGLPFIGYDTDGQIICTAYSGQGMTFGTVAGMLARDLVLGQKNPWAELFDPKHKAASLSHAWDYLVENKDYPYYLVKGLLSGGDAKQVADVPAGEGRIIRCGGQKTAVYRSPSGEVTRLSPICPHLGCVVVWNDAEKRWDCPCHGSRFEPSGAVIGGPAETALAPREV